MVSSVATTLFVLAFVLAPGKPAHQPVAFSEFLAEVEQGLVSEIRVHGHVYTFDVMRSEKSVTHQATGPSATLEELRQLRPTNPALPAPEVSVR